jgi:hypothetical protein
MPIEFTEDEKATLIDLLVGTIERDPFPLVIAASSYVEFWQS